MDRNYSVAVKLFGPGTISDTRQAGGIDLTPGRGMLQTNRWVPGEIIVEKVEVLIEPGTSLPELAELAQPALDRLAQQTGETANFAVPQADGVVQVSQVDGRYLPGATNWVYIEVPPHCSALGKVFYAFGRLPLPEGPLEARTPSTIVNRAASHFSAGGFTGVVGS